MKKILLGLLMFNFSGVMASSLVNSCEKIDLPKGNWFLSIPGIPGRPRLGNYMKNIPLEIEIKSNASLVSIISGSNVYSSETPTPSKIYEISSNSSIEEYNNFNYLLLVDQPEFGCVLYLISTDQMPITWDNIWNAPVLNYVIEKRDFTYAFNLRESYDGFKSIAAILGPSN